MTVHSVLSPLPPAAVGSTSRPTGARLRFVRSGWLRGVPTLSWPQLAGVVGQGVHSSLVRGGLAQTALVSRAGGHAG